jgi:hypothetical protein
MNQMWQAVSGNPFFTVALPIILAMFFTGWWQNKRIDDLRHDTYRGFDDLRKDTNRGFDQNNTRLDKIDVRLDVLSERVARLEGPPVVRR